MLQCDFTDPFILKWFKLLEEGHPFIIGLNLLEIPKAIYQIGHVQMMFCVKCQLILFQFLKDNPVAHVLFKNVQISLQTFKDGQIVNRVNHSASETEERLRNMAEIRALSHFLKFLEGIASMSYTSSVILLNLNYNNNFYIFV